MPTRKRDYYNHNTGSYGAYTNDQLKAVQLPDRIKCSSCKKDRLANCFSTTQQNEVRGAIKGSGPNSVYDVRCIPCTGGPRLEMRCIHCGEYKGLEGFAKAHRKTPDEAVCMPCMTERLAFEPAHLEANPSAKAPYNESEDESESGSDENRPDDGDYDDSDDGYSLSQPTVTHDGPVSSMGTGLKSMSVNGTTTGSMVSSQPASTFFSLKTMNSTGYGSSNGVKLNGSQASSGVKDYGARARTVAAAAGNSGNPRFPKVRAHRPETGQHVPLRAHKPFEHESDEEAIEYSSFSSDDDDDDDDAADDSD